MWTLRRNSKSWGRCGDAHPSLKRKNGRTRGRSNSCLPGHRVCLDLCQAKAVLPKRCLGVSFFPNPNALGRLVLVFCFFFCFALLFCDRVVVEGASSLFFFLQVRFLLLLVVDPVVLTVYLLVGFVCVVAKERVHVVF